MQQPWYTRFLKEKFCQHKKIAKVYSEPFQGTLKKGMISKEHLGIWTCQSVKLPLRSYHRTILVPTGRATHNRLIFHS